MEKRSTDKNTDARKPAKEKTVHKGENEKDSTDKDVYHDDNRKNMYDEEVGRALKGSGRAD